jgi:hypothetical protein
MHAMMSHRIVTTLARRRAGYARRAIAAGAAGALAAIATSVGAQEIPLTGPLRFCPDAEFSVPTRFEWSYWIAGSGLVDATPRVSGAGYAGVGAEITGTVVNYVGFPARGLPPRLRSPEVRAKLLPYRHTYFGQLRAGAWAQAATRPTGALVEGGATLHLGTVADALEQLWTAAPWGTFDLRAGAGYGAFPGEHSPFMSLGLGWGYRFRTDRTLWGSSCDPVPATVLSREAKIGRLVVTGRRAAHGDVWEIGIGLELSPTAAISLARTCGSAINAGGPAL